MLSKTPNRLICIIRRRGRGPNTPKSSRSVTPAPAAPSPRTPVSVSSASRPASTPLPSSTSRPASASRPTSTSRPTTSRVYDRSKFTHKAPIEFPSTEEEEDSDPKAKKLQRAPTTKKGAFTLLSSPREFESSEEDDYDPSPKKQRRPVPATDTSTLVRAADIYCFCRLLNGRKIWL